jgi:hypothetical protein
MRWPINDDCTGDPPGELMMMATALARLTEKAFFNCDSTVSSDRPRRPRLPDCEITPLKRTTGTTDLRRRQNIILDRSPILPISLHLASLPITHCRSRIADHALPIIHFRSSIGDHA